MGVSYSTTASYRPTLRSHTALRSMASMRPRSTVTEIRGLRRLEDPAFQDQLQVAGQVGAPAPGQVVSGGIAVLQSAVTLAGFLGTLIVLSPPMAAVVVVTAIPAVYLQRGIARRQAALYSDISHGQRRQFFYASLLTSLAAAKEIRLLGIGRFFRARMLGGLAATHQASQQVDRRVLASESGLAAIGALVAVVGLVWAAWQSAAGRLTVGDVSVFVVALGSVSQAVEVLIISAAMTYQALLMFQGYNDVARPGRGTRDPHDADRDPGRPCQRTDLAPAERRPRRRPHPGAFRRRRPRTGDHNTLMAWPGLYARMFTLQAQGYSAAPATVAASHD